MKKILFPLVALTAITCTVATAKNRKPSLYPEKSLTDRGVLYMERKDREKLNFMIPVYDCGGTQTHTWFSGTNSLTTAGIPNGQEPTLLTGYIEGIYNFIKVTRKGDMYLIHASNRNKPVYFYVRSADLDSLGYTYIPLKTIDEACTRNENWAQDMTGSLLNRYLPRQSEPAQVAGEKTESPDSLTLIDRNYFVRRSLRTPLYILRESPSIDSPFLEIEGPVQGHGFKILKTKGNWLKLEMNIRYKYTSNGNVGMAVFTGGPYTGWWHAPYDEEGYPVLIVDMVKPNAWEQIAAIARGVNRDKINTPINPPGD